MDRLVASGADTIAVVLIRHQQKYIGPVMTEKNYCKMKATEICECAKAIWEEKAPVFRTGWREVM